MFFILKRCFGVYRRNATRLVASKRSYSSVNKGIFFKTQRMFSTRFYGTSNPTLQKSKQKNMLSKLQKRNFSVFFHETNITNSVNGRVVSFFAPTDPGLKYPLADIYPGTSQSVSGTVQYILSWNLGGTPKVFESDTKDIIMVDDINGDLTETQLLGGGYIAVKLSDGRTVQFLTESGLPPPDSNNILLGGLSGLNELDDSNDSTEVNELSDDSHDVEDEQNDVNDSENEQDESDSDDDESDSDDDNEEDDGNDSNDDDDDQNGANEQNDTDELDESNDLNDTNDQDEPNEELRFYDPNEVTNEQDEVVDDLSENVGNDFENELVFVEENNDDLAVVEEPNDELVFSGENNDDEEVVENDEQPQDANDTDDVDTENDNNENDDNNDDENDDNDDDDDFSDLGEMPDPSDPAYADYIRRMALKLKREARRNRMR